MTSPLESFNIIKVDFSHTTVFSSTIYIVLVLISFLIIINLLSNSIINWLGILLGKVISHFHKALDGNIEGNRLNSYSYIPYILTVFIIVLIANLIGLIPYSFTVTAQFIVILFLSTSNIIGVTLIGLSLHKLNWFKLFIPKGINPVILPVIVIIEIISYLSRVLSLTIRLSANMIAGHSILAIFSSLGLLFFSSYLAMIPIIIPIILLELFVAFIQAYVYSILLSIYIKDSVSLNH